MISILVVALLFICLTFSLWLNFRLASLVIFYANVPMPPSSPFPCHKGREYTITQFPIVPLVLKWTFRYHEVNPKLSNPWMREAVKRAKTAK